ncbi:MAG TPA: hypothetical protein ENK57_14295 [Polyangiaceae bacterium]|nr:hypothetical protein [Polyangiaceae bacterium]
MSLATLERVERELDIILDDDVLTVMALADPLLRMLSGIEDVNSVADAAACLASWRSRPP